jgi:hypothetical protein
MSRHWRIRLRSIRAGVSWTPADASNAVGCSVRGKAGVNTKGATTLGPSKGLVAICGPPCRVSRLFNRDRTMAPVRATIKALTLIPTS